MPYETVERRARLFLSYKGVRVYETYKDDDIVQGASDFWFVLDPEHGEESPDAFDVRDLKTWKEPKHPPYLSLTDMSPKQYSEASAAWDKWYKSGVQRKAIKAAIRAAIEKRYLTYHR